MLAISAHEDRRAFFDLWMEEDSAGMPGALVDGVAGTSASKPPEEYPSLLNLSRRMGTLSVSDKSFCGSTAARPTNEPCLK